MKNFNYFLKEAIANLFTNKIVTLTTLITVMVSLLIIGAFNIVSFNIIHISKDFGNTYEFNIYIRDSVLDKDLESVGENIRSVNYVKSAVLKSKTQTLKEVKEKFDKNAAIQKLSGKDNPFRNCYVVTLTELGKSKEAIDTIKKIPQVETVSDNVETSQKIDTLSKKITLYTIISYILLSILCLSIVANIINVSIFSRRKHINIMKYVGATNGFVRIPFIIEGIIIGFLGAILSTGILWYIYYCLFGNFSHIINGMTLMQPYAVAQSVLISGVSYGLVIGAIGAVFAVNKHLKV